MLHEYISVMLTCKIHLQMLLLGHTQTTAAAASKINYYSTERFFAITGTCKIYICNCFIVRGWLMLFEYSVVVGILSAETQHTVKSIGNVCFFWHEMFYVENPIF